MRIRSRSRSSDAEHPEARPFLRPLPFTALGVAALLSGLAGPWVIDWATDTGRVGAGSAAVEVVDPGPTYAPFLVEPTVRFEEVDPSRPPRTSGQEPGREVGQRPMQPGAGPAPPERLMVPRLGVNAPVVGIAASSQVLVPPSDPQTLGWWTGGAQPGARFGGALITGHTVSTGGGAFDDLELLRPSDKVAVRTAHGSLRYAVTSVSVYGKASLARDAERVFSQSVPGRLVLVTCEDWDGVRYLSNVVVFAEPVR